jgi:hypothetical protein
VPAEVVNAGEGRSPVCQQEAKSAPLSGTEKCTT